MRSDTQPEDLARYKKAREEVESLRRMGSALAVRGDLVEATDRYEQAIDICKQLFDREGIEDFGAEELIAVNIVYDHQARRRSYELLAEVFGL
jgi:hypothetical protein